MQDSTCSQNVEIGVKIIRLQVAPNLPDTILLQIHHLCHGMAMGKMFAGPVSVLNHVWNTQLSWLSALSALDCNQPRP